MSSERQIKSARANGAKSQGPKTPQGKLRSSANSLRHGLLARTVLLSDEDQEFFAEHLAGLDATFEPQNEFERFCVRSLAVSSWQAMRVWGIENSTLETEIEKQENPDLNPVTRAALAFRTLADAGRSVELFGRYATQHNRQVSRAFNMILKWRDRRRRKYEQNTLDFRTNPIPKSNTDSQSPLKDTK